MRWWIPLFALVTLCLTSCGGSTPQCTPGESARCFCADGEGAQTCGPNGSFGTCECGSNNMTTSANNTTPNSSTMNNMTIPANNMTTPANNMTTPTNNMTTANTNNTTNNTTNTGPQFCKQSCNVAADCAVFGDPAVWSCNNHVCDTNPCTTDAGCVKQMSNFTPGCNSSNQCDIGFTCVTIDGANYCAFAPLAGFFGCDELQLDEIMATSVDTGMPAAVCAAPDAMCEQSTGYCFRPCTTDTECRPGGAMNGLVCMPNGQCGCTEDANCTISGDVCIDGECGCSDQRVCDTISGMAGVPFVCAP